MNDNIGLVTFSTSYNNYGQVLQAYATQEYLKSRNHKVFLLREVKTLKERIVFQAKVIIKEFVLLLTQSSKVRKSLDSQLERRRNESVFLEEDKKHPRYFESFRQQYFTIIDSDSSSVNSNNITILCAGSDQIWYGQNHFFFLDFGGEKLKRISIATSTGNKVFPQKTKDVMAQWLRRFSFITVREQSGLQLCYELGRNDAQQILDPTFLLDSTDYSRLLSDNNENIEDYIFVYLLNAPSAISIEDIHAFAKENGLTVKYVTGQGRIDEYDKIYASVPEWLSLLRGAKYVITNSFHGMAFSIIYRKAFMVLPRIGESKNMNERIESIANLMNLVDRIYTGNLSQIFNKVDYRTASEVIHDNRVKLDTIMKKFSI